jgi:hypothetical protein
MTTAWALLVRGQLDRAIATNAGGTLLGMLAVLAVPWLLASAARGRWVWCRPKPPWIVAIMVLVVVVTLTDWLVRLLAS